MWIVEFNGEDVGWTFPTLEAAWMEVQRFPELHATVVRDSTCVMVSV